MTVTQAPRLIVIMGVSGSGKSTVAAAVAAHYGYPFLEADDYHDADCKAHMAAGKPLTDTMREPWIERIKTALQQTRGSFADSSGAGCVLSFSGLRAAHRAQIRDTPLSTLFIYLQGDPATISKRMSQRAGHFMPPSLLGSQFDALEDPSDDAETRVIDVSTSLDEVINQTITSIDSFFAREHAPNPNN